MASKKQKNRFSFEVILAYVAIIILFGWLITAFAEFLGVLDLLKKLIY